MANLETQTHSMIFERPSRAYDRYLVIFESLKGMWALLKLKRLLVSCFRNCLPKTVISAPFRPGQASLCICLELWSICWFSWPLPVYFRWIQSLKPVKNQPNRLSSACPWDTWSLQTHSTSAKQWSGWLRDCGTIAYSLWNQTYCCCLLGLSQLYGFPHARIQLFWSSDRDFC